MKQNKILATKILTDIHLSVKENVPFEVAVGKIEMILDKFVENIEKEATKTASLKGNDSKQS